MIRENLLCPFCYRDLTKEIIGNSLDIRCGTLSRYKKCPSCLNDFVECSRDNKSYLISKEENIKLGIICEAEELAEDMRCLSDKDRLEVMSKFHDIFCEHCGCIKTHERVGMKVCYCMCDE